MTSPLWKQHFSVENQTSGNWKKHFRNEKELVQFDTNTKELLQAMKGILNAEKNTSWHCLWNATLSFNWLMAFLDTLEPYVTVFNADGLNADDYKTWDDATQTWVEVTGIRGQLNDLIHETRGVLGKINELRRIEFEATSGIAGLLLQLGQCAY